MFELPQPAWLSSKPSSGRLRKRQPGWRHSRWEKIEEPHVRATAPPPCYAMQPSYDREFLGIKWLV